MILVMMPVADMHLQCSLVLDYVPGQMPAASQCCRQPATTAVQVKIRQTGQHPGHEPSARLWRCDEHCGIAQLYPERVDGPTWINVPVDAENLDPRLYEQDTYLLDCPFDCGTQWRVPLALHDRKGGHVDVEVPDEVNAYLREHHNRHLREKGLEHLIRE